MCTVLRIDSFSGVVFMLKSLTVTLNLPGLAPNLEITIIEPMSYRITNTNPIAPFIREIHTTFKIDLKIALIDLDLSPRSHKPYHNVSPT